MTILWNICAWTGLIWWCCAIVFWGLMVCAVYGRTEYFEPQEYMSDDET